METVELQRTLVKSPPELWDELSAEPGISRWLGEIRIYKAEAPKRLEWGGRGAHGVIELEPSGWGTRVRAQASIEPPPRLGRCSGAPRSPDIEQRLGQLLDDLGDGSLERAVSALRKTRRPGVPCRHRGNRLHPRGAGPAAGDRPTSSGRRSSCSAS